MEEEEKEGPKEQGEEYEGEKEGNQCEKCSLYLL